MACHRHREPVGPTIDADGERLGFGTAFVSERYNKKEAATLSGAVGAVSERLVIQTAATNHNTRHPTVTAGYARTLHSLTGGRCVLGLGRGITPPQDAYGIDRSTTGQMEDFAKKFGLILTVAFAALMIIIGGAVAHSIIS